MDIKQNLQKFKLTPNPLKDQFFLTDDSVIKKMISVAHLNKNDVVLEIGAGPGNLTHEIAKYAGRVITFEIDKRFEPFLSELPKNVDVHYENAWNYVRMHGKFRKKKIYNKVIANPPYTFIEPFLHNLTFVDYDKVILLVPGRFLKKTGKWGIFGAFFDPKIIMKVPKESFFPTPRTDSIIIDLGKLPDPSETKNPGRFLRQYMYKHESQLVKNSLMEGLIKYYKQALSKELTKNEARILISKKVIPERLLEGSPNTSDVYELVEEKFNSN